MGLGGQQRGEEAPGEAAAHVAVALDARVLEEDGGARHDQRRLRVVLERRVDVADVRVPLRRLRRPFAAAAVEADRVVVRRPPLAALARALAGAGVLVLPCASRVQRVVVVVVGTPQGERAAAVFAEQRAAPRGPPPQAR